MIKKKKKKKKSLNISINILLKSIMIKENINIFQLMYLTIFFYVIKKFDFVFKQICKNFI